MLKRENKEPSTFHVEFAKKQSETHENAKAKGFYDQVRNVGELVALIHAECSEVLEVMRKPSTLRKSEKIAAYFEIEEELADIIIRTMDLAEYLRCDLGGAVEAKMAYNKTRPHKHGKMF